MTDLQKEASKKGADSLAARALERLRFLEMQVNSQSITVARSLSRDHAMGVGRIRAGTHNGLD